VAEQARWIAAAEAALDASGALIRRYFRTRLAADVKADETPVTEADRLAEETLRQILGLAFPDHGLLGEELPEFRPDARYVWAIDPIDGTRAFITGRPSFCTLLALLEDGVPVLGLIDQPVTGERWVGGRGVPCRFKGSLGGTPGTSQVRQLDRAELSSTSPEALGEGAGRFDRLKSQCKRIYWGGDAYAYGLLALGGIDIVAEYGLNAWDWAALAPVVEAAGGAITDWSGRRLRLGADGSVLAAATPELHEAALAALRGI
jgi:myo-inositol-1(or 4)-monophosphatase